MKHVQVKFFHLKLMKNVYSKSKLTELDTFHFSNVINIFEPMISGTKVVIFPMKFNFLCITTLV